MNTMLIRLAVFLTICVVVIEPKIGMVPAGFVKTDFPADFVFGSGTAANQVEGATLEDGRTPSILDTFIKSSGNNSPPYFVIRLGGQYNYTHLKWLIWHDTSDIYHGPNIDIGCDAYHKYKEDIQLMADMGLQAYRFSISWSRLIPNGRGSINPKGLQYYNNVINQLLAHGIQPHVTLNHWDLPQVLEDEYDGWLSTKSIEDFVAYADVCFREFGDRVLLWITFNEPNLQALSGYTDGLSSPGRCSYPFGNCTNGNSSTEPYIAGHNMLLAHAYAVSLYRTKYKVIQNGQIGVDLSAQWYEPYADVPEDVLASERAVIFKMGWFAEPLVFGDYPDIMKKRVGSRMPTFTEVEKKTIKGSFDFLGLNHYFAELVKANPSVTVTGPRDFYSDVGAKVLVDESFLSRLNPSSMTKILEYFKNEYGNPPIYIHENGKALQHNSSVKDTVRIDYLSAYMGSMLDAIRNGSNTKGYFAWSFIDVLELSEAYDYSLGLYYVDFNDKELKRVPKLSAHWYSSFLLQGKSLIIKEM